MSRTLYTDSSYETPYLAASGAGPTDTYDHWFTDQGCTTPLVIGPGGNNTNGDAPGTAADTLDLNGFGPTFTDISGVTLASVILTNGSLTLAGAFSATSCTFNLTGLTCPGGFDGVTNTYGNGLSLVVNGGSNSIGGTWVGDIQSSGDSDTTLATGWKVKNGAAGGNITIGGGTSPVSIRIQAPASGAGQVKAFNNITLATDGGGSHSIDMSSVPAFKLTGIMAITMGSGGVWTGPGTITLNSAGASISVPGCSIVQGDIPALSSVLTTDTLFDVAGTLIQRPPTVIEA